MAVTLSKNFVDSARATDSPDIIAFFRQVFRAIKVGGEEKKTKYTK